MRRICWIFLIAAGMVAGAPAQDNPASTDEATEVQNANPEQPLESPPVGRDAGRMRMRWAFQHIVRELELDDGQRAKFEEITAKHEETMLDLEERWREIRDAQRAGDRERADKLRAEMRAQRGPDGGMEQILDELEPLLRDDQVVKLWEVREQTAQRRMNREHYQWVMSDLPEMLNLSPEQRIHYRTVLDSQRNKMRERMTELQPLMEQLREARTAGDMDRMREIQEQLQDASPSREQMIEEFLDELPKILHEDQLELLAQAVVDREGMKAEAAESNGAILDVREVLRAARRARLRDDQRDQLREIEREAIVSYRQTSRRDQEAQTKLAEETKAKLLSLFDEKQKEDFEKALQKSAGRERRTDKP